MKVITAIEKHKKQSSDEIFTFLAGGITNCKEWQNAVLNKLNEFEIDDNLIVFNPRRKNFPINDPTASLDQIRWEFETHIKVDLINQLDEMYWNFYKNISKVKFIERFINAVEKNPLNVVSNFISLLLKMKNDDTTSLRLFAACYIINDKEYLLRAIKWLKEHFK